jgi:hypothetical protein
MDRYQRQISKREITDAVINFGRFDYDNRGFLIARSLATDEILCFDINGTIDRSGSGAATLAVTPEPACELIFTANGFGGSAGYHLFGGWEYDEDAG